MNAKLHRLLAPPFLWPLSALLTLGTVAIAAVIVAATTAAEPANTVGNPLAFANGEPVPDGHWSVLCIDGVAYLQIGSPLGQTLVPKYRRNGLVETCTLPTAKD